MAAFINTNIASLNAQRNLNASQGALQTSLQRLSSGLRINSAKDDAAGLAIADRFSTQIRGLNQAVRNANDGISLAQTAEGALGEMGNNLQRIRELAVQAANSTNSASDRKAINEEVQQRLAEIDRTSSQTSFNGQKILDGSFGKAKFQVGANVGETIDVSLDTNMRTNSVGKIATGSSTVFGASATNGEVTTGAITAFDFRAASAATGGSYTVSPTTMLYSAASSGGSGGSLAMTGLNQTNFADAGAAAVKASNTQTFTGSADFSGAGALAQFDVTIGGTTVGVTLNADYTDADGVAAAIQQQLNNAVGDGSQITVTNSGGTFKIEADTALTTSAISVSATDANATGAGFAASSGTVGAAAGAAASAASFVVDGTVITLNADYTDQSGVAAAIQTQLQGTPATANYSVAIGAGGAFQITNNTIGSAAVQVTSNGTALEGGWVAAADSGTATAGVAAVSNKDASFMVDGAAVTLDADYASFDAMAAGLQGKINALGGAYADYTVSNSNGALTITKGSGDQTAVSITANSSASANQQTNATSSGLLGGTGAAGAAEITSNNGSFNVDGTTITLDQNYGSLSALAGAIQSQLQGATGTSTYTATADGSGIKITGSVNTTPVSISALSGDAGAAGFAAISGTGGVSAGTVTLSEFTVKAGSNKEVDLSGTYTNGQQLVDAINSRVSGVTASLDSGKLKLTSSSEITLGGASATASAAMGGLGFASGTIAADNGKLSDANTLTTDAANETIQRIDSAMASVNSLRSTLGAVQNRFESVISNLSSTSENLSAARSRIQDADFAAETATLTRGQILQQAGTAMLAQANSLPNGVLALLRG